MGSGLATTGVATTGVATTGVATTGAEGSAVVLTAFGKGQIRVKST